MNLKGYFFLCAFFGSTLLHASTKLEEIALRKAIRQGNHTQAAILLEKNIDVNAVDEKGWSALHYACKNGMVDTARLLIKSGARVDGYEHTQTPLSLALEKRSEELTLLLLEHGATINCKLPLHAVIEHRRLDLLELLIEHGVNLRQVDEEGKTLLHSAVKAQDSYITSLLLSHGLDALKKDKNGKTAFDYAYAHYDEHSMALLINEGHYPLSELRKIDAELYKAIQQHGTKALIGWFNRAQQFKTSPYFSNQEETMQVEDLLKVALGIGACFIGLGYALYKIMHPEALLQRPNNYRENQRVAVSLLAATVQSALQASQNILIEKAKHALSFALLVSVHSPANLPIAIRGAASYFLGTFNEQKAVLEQLLINLKLDENLALQRELLRALTATYYALINDLFIKVLLDNKNVLRGDENAFDLSQTIEAA